MINMYEYNCFFDFTIRSYEKHRWEIASQGIWLLKRSLWLCYLHEQVQQGIIVNINIKIASILTILWLSFTASAD